MMEIDELGDEADKDAPRDGRASFFAGACYGPRSAAGITATPSLRR